MRLWKEKNAVSVVIGAIMIFAIMMVIYTSVQVTQVPAWNRKLEFQAFETTYGDMLALKADTGQVALGGMPKSTAIHMGARYPDRPFFSNPGQGVSGALIKEDAPITVQYFYENIPPSPPDEPEAPDEGAQHYLYAFRGTNTTTFWRYDTATGEWSAMASAPTNVQVGGGLAYTGSFIYALAGGDSKSFWRYDIPSNTWSNLADTPAFVRDGTAILYAGGYVYVLRARNSKTFWRYNIATNTWSNMADTPDSISDGGALIYDGTYIYAQAGGGRSNFYRYNITTNTWSSMAATPGTVKEGGALTFDGTSIFGLGGHNTQKFWRYDITANTWSDMANTPVGVDYGGALAFGGGYIYALQGNNDAGFWRYDIPSNTWSTLTGTPSSVYAGGALVFQDTAIGISRLVFVTSSQSLATASVSAVMTIQTQDAAGAPLNVSTNTPITLTTTSMTGRFDTSASGAFDGSITSVTITAGGGSASFYYKDTVAGMPTVTAAESPSQGWVDATQQETVYPAGTAVTLTYPSNRLVYEARGDIAATITYEHGLIIRQYQNGSVTTDSQSLIVGDYIYIPVVDASEFIPISSLETVSVNLKPYPEVSARMKINSVIVTLPTAFPEVWEDLLEGLNTASTIAAVDRNAKTVTITSSATKQITLPAGSVSGEGLYIGMISFSTREEPPIPTGVTIIDPTTDYPRVINVTITSVGDADNKKTHSTITTTVMNATGPYDIHADLTDLTKNPADYDVSPNYASPDSISATSWDYPNNNTVEWQDIVHPEYDPGDAVLVKFWIYNSTLNQQYSVITVFERQSETDWETIE